MGKLLINDDDAMEVMDYLIKQDDDYAEYLAETFIYPKLNMKITYLDYVRKYFKKEELSKDFGCNKHKDK